MGLVIAFTCFSLFTLYVQHEQSFDDFHSKGDRIYRVIRVNQTPSGDRHESRTSIHLAAAMKSEVPGIENSVRILPGSQTWVDTGDKRFFEDDHLLVTEEFFDVFDFEILKGNPESLIEPFSVLLTESIAKKYFDAANPIGQVLNYGRYGDFTVKAVVTDPPTSSNLRFNALLTPDLDYYLSNTHPRFPSWFNSWEGTPSATYVVFNEGAQKEEIEQNLTALLQKYQGDNWEETPYYLQNIKEQHLGSTDVYAFDIAPKGNVKYIYIYSGIGILILFIAGFNYVNLTSARSLTRTKEVGLRRTLGASKTGIINQLLIEALIVAFMALPISLELVVVLLPYFESVTQTTIELNFQRFQSLLMVIVPVTILFAAISGLYPALYLSKFKLSEILKSRSKLTGNPILRNMMVIGQFAVSLILIVAALVVSNQIDFVTDKDLGFDEEQLLVVEVNGAGIRRNFNTFKNELISHSNIENVAAFSVIVSGSREPESIAVNKLEEPLAAPASMEFYAMDEDGISTLGLELVAGEDFTGRQDVDSTSTILNESAAALFGGEQIVGQWIEVEEPDRLRVRVVGIVKDFHFRSMFEPIKPLMLGYIRNPIEDMDDIVIRLKGGKFDENLAFVESLHNQFDENQILEWTLLDQMVDDFYKKDKTFKEVYAIGSGLAIVIACLGLLGLASFMANQRLKEFGIRKVLGATINQIVGMQWWQFIKLILLANVIAVPIVWILMDNWLQGYAYRIDIGLPVFGIAAAVVLVTALVTISFESIKVALSNPVETLRNE